MLKALTSLRKRIEAEAKAEAAVPARHRKTLCCSDRFWMSLRKRINLISKDRALRDGGLCFLEFPVGFKYDLTVDSSVT